MADTRLFFKVDVGYFMNPKVNAIRIASRTANGNAILAHLASVAYSAQHRTDGLIPPDLILGMVAATPEDEELLEQGGLWHTEGHDCPDCPDVPPGQAYVHDFLEHNESRDQMNRRSSAGKAGAAARWGAKPSGIRNAAGSANRIAMGNANRNAEKRREEKITTPPPEGALFESFYSEYPRKIGKKKAETAFNAAVKTGVDPQAIIDAAKLYAASVKDSEKKFIAHPTTWLHAGRWDDEIELPPTGTEGGPTIWDSIQPRQNKH